MHAFWKWEVSEKHKKLPKQYAASYDEKKAEVDAIQKISDEVKNAIIEKWITYCKADNLNKFMHWRLAVMKEKLDVKSNIALKMRLEMNRIKINK